MDGNVARDILRAFEAARPTTEPTKAWSWADGVITFPDAVCPFCKVVMKSPCIWRVNEERQRLEGVVGIQGSLLVNMRTRHPHVDCNGVVCMNGYGGRYGASTQSDSVATALFLAIYPASTMGGFGRDRQFGHWDEWFRDYFGHTKHDEVGLRRRNRPTLTLAKL